MKSLYGVMVYLNKLSVLDGVVYFETEEEAKKFIKWEKKRTQNSDNILYFILKMHKWDFKNNKYRGI